MVEVLLGFKSMKIRKLAQSGFTLVEMMIVVAIVGLLCAIAIPNFLKARNLSRLRICVNNLRQIDSAKDQWALENGLSTGDACAIDDIMPYLRRTEPKCPVGTAAYIVNKIGTTAECNSVAKVEHNAEYNPGS